GPHEAEGGRGVLRAQITGDDGPGPPTDAGEDRNVLLAIGPSIRDRLANHTGAGLELPQRYAAAGVERFDHPLHIAVKDQIAGRGEGAAPHREALAHLPHGTPLYRVPGGELAAVPARPCLHDHVHSDVWRAGDVVRL